MGVKCLKVAQDSAVISGGPWTPGFNHGFLPTITINNRRHIMNQGTSGGQIPDIFTPAFEWGDGHALRFATAERLTHEHFAAQTIIVIDSCFTQAIYGQHTEKHDWRRIHHIQTLHTNNVELDEDAKLVVLQAYEISKNTLSNFYEN